MKPGRTPEDRERARLEREAKRAAREGRPPPEALAPTEVAPPEFGGPEPVSEVEEPREAQALPPEPDLHEPETTLPEPVPEPVLREPDPEPESAAREPEHEAPAFQVEADQPPWAGPEDSDPLDPVEAPTFEQDDDEDILAEEDPLDDDAYVPGGDLPPDEESFPDDEPLSDHEPLPGDEPFSDSDDGLADEETRVQPPQPRRPTAPPPFVPSAASAAGRGAAARSATAREILERRRAREAAGSRVPGDRRRLRLIPLAAAVVLAVVGLWLLGSLFQPFADDGEGVVKVNVPSGSSVGAIADLLEREGVVSSAFFFRARATVSGRTGDFKAGKFDLKSGMSYGAAMDALSKSPALDTVTVTIPEGLSRRQAKAVVAQSLDGDYLALTKRSRLLSPRDFGAKGASDLEGFLFPATYELKRGKGVKELVRQQLAAFREKFAGVDLSAARSRNLSRYDVLIIASMIEREAQIAKERPLVASVIYNRLSEGIPLGIDATTRFAVNNYTEPLKESELAVDSPYNTRERQGLPPGPIGSPGIASIEAAARPARTDFLFYVVKPNTCGEHDFSETSAEFEQDVARYNTEREARGGKSPTNC